MTASPPKPSPEPVAEATFDRRPYLMIRPAETAIDSDRFVRAVDHVLARLREASSTGLRDRLLGRTDGPVLEVLLVSNGRADPSLGYFVGCSNDVLLPDIEGILRTGLPDTYEFSTVEWHPRLVEAHHSLSFGDDSTAPPAVAGVEYLGRAKRPLDYLTPLRAVTDQPSQRTATERSPLSALAETMIGADHPVIYQVVCRAHVDCTAAADDYHYTLKNGSHDWWGKIIEPHLGQTPDRQDTPGPDVQRRLDGIVGRDPSRTFVVSARAVVLDGDEDDAAVARHLTSALSPLDGRIHTISGRIVADGDALYDDLCTRTVHDPEYGRLRNRLPLRPALSRGIVVAHDEFPGFCAVDGAGLTPAGRRAFATRPLERTGIPRPPPHQLERLTPPGMVLGTPLDADRKPTDRPLYLPPTDQDEHVIIVGSTGAGKSVLMSSAALTNVEATDGPAIIFDHKGGGTSTEYLMTHYQRYGSLDDVLYFDCARYLPAISVLDLAPLLTADLPRKEAVSRIAGQFEEILITLMGRERFEAAIESPKIITAHLEALLDPATETNAIPTSELLTALVRTHTDGSPPGVSDPNLEQFFGNLLEREHGIFQKVMSGATNRVETITTNSRLAPMFDHTPGDDDPHFDFADVIDEDTVVLFDFGGMEDDAKGALTAALLSVLVRALFARAEDPDTPASPPLVNVYIEEAGVIGESDLLNTLLSRGRSYGLSLFLGLQHLQQFDPHGRTYAEALNETATIIAGPTPSSRDLARALATEAMPPPAVERRLARLPKGEWLLRPGTGFGDDSISPFLIESPPAPAGHPAGDGPLDPAATGRFETALEAVATRTCETVGLPHDPEPTPRDPDPDAAAPEPRRRVDSAYPYAKRMPPTVDYHPEAHVLFCLQCENRFEPHIDGMRRAIECHSSLDDVDRRDVPIGQLASKRSADERRAHELTDPQFMFTQAIHTAQHDRFDPLEYDLRTDSMTHLRDCVRISDEAVQELIDRGIIVKDTDYPYTLYSVTSYGREVIGEHLRDGVDYGPGIGDLGESAQHKMAVLVGLDYLAQEYRDNPDSPVVRVERYYDLGGHERLDAAGLDADDAIVVTLEAERINNDYRRAIPSDFDKMAACTPDEAIWIVMKQSEGHKLLEALADPFDGKPRVSKTYAPTTPPEQFIVDEPGLTTVLAIANVRRELGT